MTSPRERSSPDTLIDAPSTEGWRRVPAWTWCLAGLVLLLATVWLYHGALEGRFLAFDDDTNITLNGHLGSLTKNTVSWAFTDTGYTRRYLPLGWLSFSTLITAFGFSATAFHATCLALHAANGLLLFLLLKRFTGAPTENGMSSWQGIALPGLLAAWWLWHPLRVESVAWASGLLYVESTTWMLLSAFAFLAGLKRSFWLWLAPLLFACSLGCYPVWLGAPVALAVAGWLQLRGEGLAPRAAVRRLLPALLPFALLSVAALAVTVAARGAAGEEWGAKIVWTAGSVLGVSLRAIATLGWFLLKILWPSVLTPADDRWIEGFFAPAALSIGLAALAATVFLCLRLKRRFGYAPLGTLLAFAAVGIPFCGLTELEYPISDRYTYAGHIVLVVALGAWLVRLKPGTARLALAALACLTLAGAVRVWRQVPVWSDNDHLFSHLSAELQSDRVRDLYTDRRMEVRLAEGRIDEVVQEPGSAERIARSERLQRLLAEARRVRAEAAQWGAANTPIANRHHQLAREAWASGDARAALAHMARVVELVPTNWPAWADYTGILWATGHRAEARQAAARIPAEGPSDVCRKYAEQILTP